MIILVTCAKFGGINFFKTNPNYNENPFNVNYYCGDLVPSDDRLKCPPQNKVYGMLASHKWLASFVDNTNSRSLSVFDNIVTYPSADEDANDSCNLCVGNGEMVLDPEFSQEMIDLVNDMTDSEANPGGLLADYIGNYNSCGQFQTALNEVDLHKEHCFNLRKHFLLLVATHGAASSCDVTCPQGKRFSPKKKVNGDAIARALGLSSSLDSNKEVACGDLASRLELLASFDGFQKEECEALQSVAGHCCTQYKEAKSAKRTKRG